MSHYSRSNDARMTTRINAATAARAVSAPVCADDDCMQCAMGLYCSNAPKATAKPRVRLTALLMTSAKYLEQAIRNAIAFVTVELTRDDGVKHELVMPRSKTPAEYFRGHEFYTITARGQVKTHAVVSMRVLQ